MLCTKINYLYRDASNYKFRGNVTIGGKVSIADLRSFLFDGVWFVPSEVGLPHLLDLPPNGDDHLLHEFEEFEAIDSNNPVCSSRNLIRRFEQASRRGWFSNISHYGYG